MNNSLKYLRIYLVIFMALFTNSIFHYLYLYIFKIDRDLGYILGFILTIIGNLFESLIILFVFIIFFNLLYKLKIKNLNLYFFILLISGIFTIIWEISYTRVFGSNTFTYFIFNRDILALLLFYIIGIGLYGYLLKYIKKIK